MGKNTGIADFFKVLAASRTKLALFALILLVATLARTLGIGNPKELYFDEVYHGYTAIQYLHGNRDAYDPWAKSPAGKANEWTHPPLSKLMMAGAMAVFGEDSFGWRIGSAICGVLSVLVLGFVAFALFGVIEISLLSMAFLSIETLHVTQSRIAMNDSYFVLFALLSVFFYIQFRKNLISKPAFKNLYFSGFFLGLCFGTKWTAFYVLGILGLDGFFSLFNTRVLYRNGFVKLVAHALLALIVLPALVYIGCYLHFFHLGFNWTEFNELQWQMWAYHTRLTATHSYQSKPWQWIFNLKPVWMFVQYLDGNQIRNIYNTGNSILLIYGLFSAFFILTFKVSKEFKKKGELGIFKVEFAWQRRFLLLTYFFLWVPWIFSPRIMLFYHYLPAVPFLMIFLAAHVWWQPGPSRRRMWASLCFSALFFIYIIPMNTAIKMPKEWIELLYYKIPGWR